MPKFNVDEEFEPITITVDGREHVITEVPTSLVEEMRKSGSGGENLGVRRIAEELLGVEDGAFSHVDIRKLSRIVGYVTNEVKKDLQAFASKNELGESAPNTP